MYATSTAHLISLNLITSNIKLSVQTMTLFWVTQFLLFRNFLSSKKSRPTMALTKPLNQWVAWFFLRGKASAACKCRGYEGVELFLYSPLHIFMAWTADNLHLQDNSNESSTRWNNFSSLLSWRLFTAQHVSGLLTPVNRSSTTAVAASGFTAVAWW